MSPQLRQLYELAETNHPALYEHLRDLDAQLAEHQTAAMQLLTARLHLLQEIAGLDATTRSAIIPALR